MSIESKFKLRQHFNDVRKHIAARYRLEAAQAAADIFTKQLSHQVGEQVACYLSFREEFDTSPLIEAIWQAKKKCYLPILSSENNKQLIFVRYEYGDRLRPNRFSILEPVNVSRVIDPAHLDLVAMPLVAFDRLGHRLGTGGGYYDYTFAFLATSEEKKPQMMGLGYAAQEAKTIPVDPWDIKMDTVLTEKEWLQF